MLLLCHFTYAKNVFMEQMSVEQGHIQVFSGCNYSFNIQDGIVGSGPFMPNHDI